MSPEDTPVTDDLVAANAAYAASFAHAGLAVDPSRGVAVVACMDARVDPAAILGLDVGDAHVIRNAGGVVTDDVIRSLCLSQRLMGTREIVLFHHTDCGLGKIDEASLSRELEAELGVKPAWSLEAFDDPYDDVAQSIRRIRLSPFVPHDDRVHGFVYDVADGRLHEVRADQR